MTTQLFGASLTPLVRIWLLFTSGAQILFDNHLFVDKGLQTLIDAPLNLNNFPLILIKWAKKIPDFTEIPLQNKGVHVQNQEFRVPDLWNLMSRNENLRFYQLFKVSTSIFGPS